MQLRTFVEETYFPSVSSRLRGSTLRGYTCIWRLYVSSLGDRPLADIRVVDCQCVLDSVVTENPALRRATLARVKSFLVEILGTAARLGLRHGSNPAKDVRINCKRQGKTETPAHSRAEVDAILARLSHNQLARTMVAVAAFTGLRRGEIVGLKWEDYTGALISVRRDICFGMKGEMSVELPKTEASEAPVPVIAPLKTILEAWKAVSGTGWMFPASSVRKSDHPAGLVDSNGRTPVDPSNVLREFEPKIQWHAFRRGLATTLHEMDVDDLTISRILRHSNVSVTRASYIKRVPAKSIEAMERLAARNYV